MNKGRIIAGIDLGSSKVATIVAQVQMNDPLSMEKSINIIGFSSTDSSGLRKGQIVDIEEAVDAIIESVEGAERMAGYNLSSAYLSIGGANISSSNSHGIVAVSNPDSEITPEDVERVIEAASAISLPSSREVLHIIPREYMVDGESGIKDPVGMSGVRLEVETHIITTSGSTTKNLRKAINEVGIEADGLVFTGFASSEAVLTKTEKELGTVLIDIGGGTTSICVFIEGSLIFSSSLPIGARNVTNDLAIGLRVSLESAEKIKLALTDFEKKSRKSKDDKNQDEFELASLGIPEIKRVSKKTLVEGIIKPRLNEIFTMVRIALDKEGLSNKIPSGVVLTGGGAETIGVTESAKRMLLLPVRIGKPYGVNGLIDDVIAPPFSAAVGLILYGAGTNVEEGFTFGKRIKISSKGILGKIFQTIKDLLP